MKSAMEKARDFTLEGHLENMRCPYLVLHGGHDVLTVTQARKVYDYGNAKGVDVHAAAARLPTRPAPSIVSTTIRRSARRSMADWLADRFGIDQRALLPGATNPLI